MLYEEVGKIKIPFIGLGTYGISFEKMGSILSFALSNGVNFFDTASKYNNEESIGSALRKEGIKREDVLICSKISYNQQMTISVQEAIDSSLTKLQTDYIDLYLIHSPKSKTYCSDWIKLSSEKKKGKFREIGVSNFGIHDLTALYNNTGCFPSINQIEVNLLHYPVELIEYCRKHNIIVQASCPLRRMDEDAMKNEYIIDLERKYDRTYSQIVLRWLYEKGLLSIPKTQEKNHLMENIKVFDFSLEKNEHLALDRISANGRG